MYSKIAIRNVRKSFKDYTIYFLTLTLAVCIFYSFNSIESQKSMIEMTSFGKYYSEVLLDMVSYASSFITVILAGLIIYANNCLIKKRNKELGIYMTLGMGKEKISNILIQETLIGGIASIISGLLLGFIASQGLSILVSNLFDVSMTEYKFTISTKAIGKTILYFGFTFIVVMVVNIYIISKYKIINLLVAGRKNEEINVENHIAYLIIFLLSIICLGVAYKFVIDAGLDPENNKFKLSIGLGIVGTVLFFLSLSTIVLNVIKNNKKIYFKGLNIFVVKQISSKIKTNFLSMSTICLMLFFTIIILSTGLGFKNALDKGLKSSTPYDASITLYKEDTLKVKSIEESLEKRGITISEDEEYITYDEYPSFEKITSLMPSIKPDVTDQSAVYIKISYYNKIQKFNGKDEIMKF